MPSHFVFLVVHGFPLLYPSGRRSASIGSAKTLATNPAGTSSSKAKFTRGIASAARTTIATVRVASADCRGPRCSFFSPQWVLHGKFNVMACDHGTYTHSNLTRNSTIQAATDHPLSCCSQPINMLTLDHRNAHDTEGASVGMAGGAPPGNRKVLPMRDHICQTVSSCL